MLGLGSFKSSRWAFDYLKSTNSFNSNVTITNPSSSFGLWNTPTVGPDGFVYMLPCADTATVNNVAGTSLTGILIVNPGNANNGNIKYTAPQSFYSEPGTNRDSIPISSTIVGSNIRFASKGILAPNGKIYFIGFTQPGVVILTPNGFSSTWQYKTFASMGLNTTVNSQTQLFTGGVLGQDGKIYLVPNKNCTARIDPDTDLISTGYWTGATGRRLRSGGSGENGFGYPRNSSGTIITPPANVPTPNSATQKTFNGLKDAIAHPDGNIYMFPYDSGGNSRWIFILNLDNWGQNNEFYSSVDLALPIPNPITGNSGSVFGSCENIFLEKLKDGQDSTTLKIYATYFGNSSYNSNWNSQYPNAKMLELDPVDNTVALVGDVNTANGGTGFFGQAAKPGIQFPNGFIVSFLAGLAGAKISNVIITGDEGGSNNTFPDSTKNIIGSGSDIATFSSFADPPNVDGSFGGSSILIDNSFGKVIFNGGSETGGIAFSVKGFYPGIKYFDSGDNIYKIPTNLAGLATSLWNSYCNKPF
jgi:hypothetical protein